MAPCMLHNVLILFTCQFRKELAAFSECPGSSQPHHCGTGCRASDILRMSRAQLAPSHRLQQLVAFSECQESSQLYHTASHRVQELAAFSECPESSQLHHTGCRSLQHSQNAQSPVSSITFSECPVSSRFHDDTGCRS